VEAQFIGLRDEKIHLHKLNGVKIAVPVPKMALEDLEYVERATGVSLDDLKPLSDLKRQQSTKRNHSSGAQVSKKSDYDWFDFFLQCGVDPQICERYSQAFTRDQMGEENMPDINQQLLRNLGLKEGDILRVIKFLDKKFNRQRQVSFDVPDGSNSTPGGLFSGPGGALRDNSRKGRPTPPVETKKDIDPGHFDKKDGDDRKTATPSKNVSGGFDDDAWAPRKSKNEPQAQTSAASPPSTEAAAPPPSQPALTPGMADLSLLDTPLQPTPAPQPAPQAVPQQQTAPPPQEPQKPTGATPSLFEQLAKGPVGQQTQQAQQQGFVPQQTGFQQQQALNAPRQRPQAPQQTQTGLIAPPPQRAASVPQNFQNQQSGFAPPPLTQQLTGYQGQPNMQTQVAPPGQSLLEQQQQQQRMQQQQQQQTGFMQTQQTGFQPNMGFNQFQQNGIMPQATGYGGQFPQNQQQNTGYGAPFQQPQPTGYQQALGNGFQNGSPFADPRPPPFVPQATGMQQFSTINPQATGVNAFLPPALMPQATGVQANQFGNASFGSFDQPPPPVPPIPSQQQALQPLIPQKTGPPPPVRFGTAGAKKLAPQPTGRKANLSQASKCFLSTHLFTHNFHLLTRLCSATKPLWFLRCI